jgi:flagellar biogenesis protein FliO
MRRADEVRPLVPRCRQSGTIVSMRRVYNSIFLAVALYGFAAWVYVAATALAQPQTLPLQLTHFAKWPRTDTFGELSFVLSFVAFVAYRLTREQSPQH